MMPHYMLSAVHNLNDSNKNEFHSSKSYDNLTFLMKIIYMRAEALYLMFVLF